jgi:hypothetical protein
MIMNETLKNNRSWRILRQVLITLAICATLIAIFYTEENWRGKRAWENCKRDFEARGYELNWDKYIPPPVPDDQNFFKAPKMQEWFVGRGQNDLSKRLGGNSKTQTIGTTNAIVSEADARTYLQWSGQFAPDFNLIREALKRPAARMDGDYSQPYNIPIPNFITVRAVAQVLAQRAHCYFLLNQPDRALDELTLIHDLRGVMQPPPSGRPITLVAAMINVAVAGLYASMVEEGFQKSVWQEPQLVALQKQLADTDLLPWVLEAFRTEPVANICLFETTSADKIVDLVSGPGPSGKAAGIWSRLKNPLYLYLEFAPRGWRYQNMVNMVSLAPRRSDSFDTEHALISPRVFEEYTRRVNQLYASMSPFKTLVAVAVPNFTKATQTTAHNQAMADEAQIACALERYRLANGVYPETLDALIPQFIEKLPHDIIGGQPLHYRREADGRFVLYSVGWNETDDGGQALPPNKNGSSDYTKGDWVWKN